jgi:predicted AAA+ superfamily ATPase
VSAPESSAEQSLIASLDHLARRVGALVDRLDARAPGVPAPDWTASTAFRARRRTGGLRLEPVMHVATIRLADLREVDAQRERLLRNTAQFVAGKPANNVLLTGARGTGKSSLIKACLNEFAPRGLRLIEIDKTDLVELPDIVDIVAARPERFVLFCDDLSFEDGDAGYKALKSALDGSVAQTSDNLLIYATSNRRHLLPEHMRDNLASTYTDDGELHPGEVVEEKISLSERFGMWISFYPFTQDEYLTIVAQWLRHFGLDDAVVATLRQEALVWALERGSRSGRVAYQFARDMAGRRG